MQLLVASSAAAKPCYASARKPAAAFKRNERARRCLHIARAESEEDRAAALKAALEQAQSNPEVAARMKQMEAAMANPAMQAQMNQMMSAMSNPTMMAKMAQLKEDPELKPVFDEIRTGGMAAMMKYMNDPQFLAKIGEKVGDVVEPAAPPTPPPAPEINNILDAAKVGDEEAIEDFMAIGKGGLTDGEGRTALHYAVAYDRTAAVQVLLDNGADTSAQEKAGNTPLHYAAGYGREQCVRMLLAAGADVSQKNEKGQTAAEVVKGEARNPLNQDAALLAVLEGKAEVASLQ